MQNVPRNVRAGFLMPLCAHKKSMAAILENFTTLYHSHMYKYAYAICTLPLLSVFLVACYTLK